MSDDIQDDIELRYRPSRNTDRYDNYREIVARYASTGACGHPIKAGDTIGYHRRHGCRCSACWRAWTAELMHPRDVFRLAIVANAQAIIIAHTHPSGDPMPSEADIRVTREMYRAGQLLRIEVLDHVIVGAPALRVPGQRGYASLRELGYFYS